MVQCSSLESSFNDQMRCVKWLLFNCGSSRRPVSELAIILLLNDSSTMSPVLGVWAKLFTNSTTVSDPGPHHVCFRVLWTHEGSVCNIHAHCFFTVKPLKKLLFLPPWHCPFPLASEHYCSSLLFKHSLASVRIIPNSTGLVLLIFSAQTSLHYTSSHLWAAHVLTILLVHLSISFPLFTVFFHSFALDLASFPDVMSIQKGLPCQSTFLWPL